MLDVVAIGDLLNFRLNYFERQDILVNNSELMTNVMSHYMQQVVGFCNFCFYSVKKIYLTIWSTDFSNIPDTLLAKQPFWDCPGIQTDWFLVESGLSYFYLFYLSINDKGHKQPLTCR